MGFCRTTLISCCSFLAGRAQGVLMGKCYSSSQDFPVRLSGLHLVTCPVNVYKRLLDKIVWRSEVKCYQYTEGTQLYLSFSSDPDPMVSVLS